MSEVIYTTQFDDFYCDKHDHLESERDCDYTRNKENGFSLGRLTRVTTTITAIIQEPDYDDVT